MATKRIGIAAGAALAATLLLGTAGYVLAQDPSPSPSASSGMMGGAGMMGGSGTESDMMDGSDMLDGAGMMSGSGMMSGPQLEQMQKIHDRMVASGACDHGTTQPKATPTSGS